MDFSDILSLGMTAIGSVLSGGVTSLIGTVVTKWAEHKQREQDLEVLRINNAHDLAVMDKEWSGRVDVARTEGEAAATVSADQAFAASFQLEPKRYLKVDNINDTWAGRWVIGPLLGIVDAWRGLIRPGMTTYLAVVVTMIYWHVMKMLDDAKFTLSSEQAWTLIHMMTATILYTFTTALLWWFGTRNKATPPRLPTG